VDSFLELRLLYRGMESKHTERWETSTISMGKDNRSSGTSLSAWKRLRPSGKEGHVSFSARPERGEFGKRDEKEVGSTRGKRGNVTWHELRQMWMINKAPQLISVSICLAFLCLEHYIWKKKCSAVEMLCCWVNEQ